ncbi:MAG: hypothetical protein CVT92_15570 [Bacteroidetes bacterium HGW-Bacteroidetes-1]|jgi:RHS repeat-associated protein|nr:MAG: hypothetical protein CVT92_15570 [Bacteroidetes bacterium HGW-Bacteroidetes-1]
MKAFKSLLIAAAMLPGTIALGQHTGTSFTLNQPITGGQHSYTATDFVKLMPGFRYLPQGSADYFMANIGESLVVEPPAEGVTGGAEPDDHGIVGTLPGSVMVSDLGSSVYTLPIQLPPGVSGMAPSLSIAYNSMAGNGMLGWGWNLTGSSAISRTGKTIYHDGILEGIKFDNTDNLSYDGNRLLEIATNSYATEIENFSKIIVKESNDYGPVWFEVMTKDGRKLHYGNTADSRQNASGKNHVLAWYLNHVEDRMGNQIDYTYYQIDGGIRISSIKYGGNIKTSQEHIYDVVFHYQNGRQDPIKNYISGSEINTNVVLTNIEIKHLSTGTKTLTYELEYDWFTGNYTRLSSIKALDKDYNEVNSTKFEWGVQNYLPESHDLLKETTEKLIDHYYFDINGDGLTDVLRVEYMFEEISNIIHKKISNWYYRLGIHGSIFGERKSLPAYPIFYSNIITGDFNGNGNTDFIVVETIPSPSDLRYINSAYFFLDNEFFIQSFGSNYSFNNDHHPEFRTADFDGDGKAEFFIAEKGKTGSQNNTHIYSVSNTNPYFSLKASQAIDYGNTHFDHSEVIISDFNGDGKSDILRTAQYGAPNGQPHTSNCFIYSVDMIGSQIQFIYGGDYPTTWHKIYPGDFNGDGLMDILTLVVENNSSLWEVHLFDGVGFQQITTPNLYNYPDCDLGSESDYFIYTGDFNGDGKDDIMQACKAANPYQMLANINYSNGTSFFQKSSFTIHDVDGSNTQNLYNHIYRKIDVNGDGNDDLFVIGAGGVDYLYIFASESNENLVYQFRNSFGTTTSLTYKSLTDPSVYTKGTSLNYPLGVIQLQINVVSSIFQQIKGEMAETTRFTYEALRVHKQGKGLLGFGKRTQTDILSGVFSIEEKELYIGNSNLFYLPYTRKSITYKSQGLLLSEVTNTMNHKSYSANPIRIFPFVESSFGKEFEYETLQHVKTFKSSNTYDTYGNVTSNIQLMHPLSLDENASSNQFDHQTTIETQYSNPDIANWWINKPLHITTTTRFKTENNIMNRGYFTFYEVGHSNYTMLHSKSNYPDNNFSDPLSTRSEYMYDAYGNMISQKLSAPNAQPALASRTVTWAYDAAYQHRFPTSEKNALNHESTTTYNNVFGFATKKVNANQHETLLDQHPLGIETKVIMPDGTMQITAKRWAAGHTDCPTEPLAALYYGWTKASGLTEELVFYHQTGLELRRVSTGFNGQKVYVDKEYDNKGRLSKESLPYFLGDTPVYTTYNYDNIGRLISVVLPDGTSNTTQYLGNKVIKTNAEGQKNTQMYNAAGWLVESEDHYNNVVKYSYFSDGNLKNTAIMDNPATSVSFQYNSRRQRTLLNDPNYGQMITTYNAFDEPLSQTNPKGQTETFVYDILGRMTHRTDNTGTTTWVYNNSGNQKGTLASVGMSGHSTSFVYDGLLRLQSETENIQGQAYTTQYSYDGFGRPLTTTYPSGYATKQVYNSYGYAKGVADNQSSQLIYETKEVNALGQLKKSYTANGYTTDNTYHPLTYRLNTVITIRPDKPVLQDMEYTWTPFGNLESRKKWLSRPGGISMTESFGYDNLNRLDWIKLNNVETGKHVYDNSGLGNLTYKKADGQALFQNAVYGGNNAGPHALTSAATSPGIFPPAQQVIVYNVFDKVTSITEGDKSLQITYGHHRQRLGQQYTAAGITTTKVYAGACEYITKNDQTTTLTYLSGQEGLFALHLKNPNGSENIRYIHMDHLGSWNTITDENGNLLQELSFDAWGNRRNPATWRAFTTTPADPFFDRGFTGHEHLYGFQLINMNGRMYDPVVSRMLSPDNFVQAPDFSQSFNRYSYCVNNPLRNCQ